MVLKKYHGEHMHILTESQKNIPSFYNIPGRKNKLLYLTYRYTNLYKSLLIKSQALFENFCEVILWHNSKTASSAGQKESRNRRNDYSFCSRLRRCAFTLP